MLYIVGTPIGNLSDITLRALDTLKSVDIIACEDTRHTKILLEHYQINKPLTSFHSCNKIRKTQELISALKNGKNIALVSDSGMPGISDPGVNLINDAIKENLEYCIIPGPTAFVGALVASGLPAHKFIFEGFLPPKELSQKNVLKKFIDEKHTVVFYESPHRIKKLLLNMLEVFGDIEIVLARELTKKFEEVKRKKISEFIFYYNNHSPRGEFVVLFNLK
ncbi:MAG: 16S rRNA (cytidine(1402)-2'-O)-methyltransferase [Candidatus Omnitrophota bacterium]